MSGSKGAVDTERGREGLAQPEGKKAGKISQRRGPLCRVSKAEETFERGVGCSQQKDQCVQRPGGLDSPLPTLGTERRGCVQRLGLEDGWSWQDEVTVPKLTGCPVRSRTSPADDREPASVFEQKSEWSPLLHQVDRGR